MRYLALGDLGSDRSGAMPTHDALLLLEELAHVCTRNKQRPQNSIPLLYVHIVCVDHNKGHEHLPESGRSRPIHLYIFLDGGLDGVPAPFIERSRPSF